MLPDQLAERHVLLLRILLVLDTREQDESAVHLRQAIHRIERAADLVHLLRREVIGLHDDLQLGANDRERCLRFVRHVLRELPQVAVVAGHLVGEADELVVQRIELVDIGKQESQFTVALHVESLQHGDGLVKGSPDTCREKTVEEVKQRDDVDADQQDGVHHAAPQFFVLRAPVPDADPVRLLVDLLFIREHPERDQVLFIGVVQGGILQVNAKGRKALDRRDLDQVAELERPVLQKRLRGDLLFNARFLDEHVLGDLLVDHVKHTVREERGADQEQHHRGNQVIPVGDVEQPHSPVNL